MKEVLVPEGQIHERLGLRTLKPFVGLRVDLKRFNWNGTVYLRRSDNIVTLLRAESNQLGGDLVLDRLADSIMEATS